MVSLSLSGRQGCVLLSDNSLSTHLLIAHYGDISVNKTDKNPSSQGVYILGDFVNLKITIDGKKDIFLYFSSYRLRNKRTEI